jgi:prolactin regulatory element-binding protein
MDYKNEKKQSELFSKIQGTQFSERVSLEFPPFGLGCQISERRVIVVGGGGDAQTGVPSGILLFEITNGKLRKLNFFDTFPQTFMNVAIHPDKEERIFCCGCDNKCFVYELSPTKDTLTKRHEFQTDWAENEDSCQKIVTFSPDGKFLLTGGTDGSVRVWRYPNFDLFRTLRVGSDPIIHVSYNTTTHLIAVGTRRTCTLWEFDPENTKEQKSLWSLAHSQEKNTDYGGCVFSSDGEFIFVAEIRRRKGSIITKWQWRTQKAVRKISLNCGVHHTAFNVSPCGAYLALGFSDGRIVILSTTNLKVVMRIPSGRAHQWIITAIQFYNEPTQQLKDVNASRTLYVLSCAADRTLACNKVVHHRKLPALLIVCLIVFIASFVLRLFWWY